MLFVIKELLIITYLLIYATFTTSTLSLYVFFCIFGKQ